MRLIGFWLLIIYMIGCVSSVSAEPETRLQAGEGRDLVLETCTACHSESLVLKNHMTRERWDETLTWMQEKQGLWELSPKERKTILDYLAAYQGVEGGGVKARSGSAMYQYYYPPNPLARKE